MAEVAIDIFDETVKGERRKAVTLRLASERLTLLASDKAIKDETILRQIRK